jgi:hypothetical protein
MVSDFGQKRRPWDTRKRQVTQLFLETWTRVELNRTGWQRCAIQSAREKSRKGDYLVPWSEYKHKIAESGN